MPEHKRAYELGQPSPSATASRPATTAWQRWAERFGRWISAVRAWKGQKLPYTLGVIDVWLLLYLIDHFGAGDYLSSRLVVENVVAWFKN